MNHGHGVYHKRQLISQTPRLGLGLRLLHNILFTTWGCRPLAERELATRRGGKRGETVPVGVNHEFEAP
jgi:hypothetical protein